MKWYYKILGGHTHVRVFMNGGKCGDLCFRNTEFFQIREWAELHECSQVIEFFNETNLKRVEES